MSTIPGPVWLPWVGGIVVVGLVGGTLGLVGVFGHPTTSRSVVTSAVGVTRTATAYACPGGPAIDALEAGDKVLAIQRSDDSAYLGVRDPLNRGREVWLRSGDVTVNPNEHTIASLPIGS